MTSCIFWPQVKGQNNLQGVVGNQTSYASHLPYQETTRNKLLVLNYLSRCSRTALRKEGARKSGKFHLLQPFRPGPEPDKTQSRSHVVTRSNFPPNLKPKTPPSEKKSLLVSPEGRLHFVLTPPLCCRIPSRERILPPPSLGLLANSHRTRVHSARHVSSLNIPAMNSSRRSPGVGGKVKVFTKRLLLYTS